MIYLLILTCINIWRNRKEINLAPNFLRVKTCPNKVIEKLIVACDDNEQYSRRSCLRINGIKKENGKKEDNIYVINKLKECYENIDVNFDSNAIDRVHRIGQMLLVLVIHI